MFSSSRPSAQRLFCRFARVFAAYALVLFCAAAPVRAEDDLGSLTGYLVEAAENNSGLRAKFHRWKAAQERIPQATALPDPRLTFGGFIRPIETRTGPQRAKLGVSQTFPWFGKLSLKGERQTQQALAAKAAVDAAKLDVFYAVKQAYYELAYITQAEAITSEIIELVRYLDRVGQAKYSAGSQPYAGVIRTQVELGRLEDRLASISDMKLPLRAQLNAAMNRPVETEVPDPPRVPVMRMCLTDEELLRGLLEANPRLLALDHSAAGEEAGIKLARKDYYPDVTAGVETIFTDDARAPGVPNDGDNPVIATLSINLPLWQAPRDAAVREAKAKLAAARRDKEGLTRQLTSQLELALYKYNDATRRIGLYRDTLIPKARQSLGVSLEAFQAGQGTSLDLLDAEKTLLELELAHLRALTDQAQRLAEMETIVGREIPCEIHGTVNRPAVLDVTTKPEKQP